MQARRSSFARSLRVPGPSSSPLTALKNAPFRYTFEMSSISTTKYWICSSASSKLHSAPDAATRRMNCRLMMSCPMAAQTAIAGPPAMRSKLAPPQIARTQNCARSAFGRCHTGAGHSVGTWLTRMNWRHAQKAQTTLSTAAFSRRRRFRSRALLPSKVDILPAYPNDRMSGMGRKRTLR